MLRTFRVELSRDLAEFAGRDLDWDPKVGKWLLSELERGSVTWDIRLRPRGSDLRELGEFFFAASADTDTLETMSPVELVEAHEHGSEGPLLRIAACPRCEHHWDVYRRDGGRWLFYGADCGVGRVYGAPAEDLDVEG